MWDSRWGHEKWNLEEDWKLLVNLEEDWKILVNLEEDWKILVNLEEDSKILVNLEEDSKILKLIGLDLMKIYNSNCQINQHWLWLITPYSSILLLL